MAETIQALTYTCPNCGGNMKWNIRSQQFECESCRTPGNIDLSGTPICQHPIGEFSRLVAESKPVPGESTAVCKNCGAVITFSGNETATVCPMCGSPQIDAERQISGVAPDGLIPFKVEKADAQEAFKKWVKSRWFAPNALKKCYQEGKLDGVYLPYFTYDSDSEAFYTGKGGKTRTYRDKDGNEHTKVDWYPVSGHVSSSFNDIPVCDASNYSKTAAAGAQPYSTEALAVPYVPAYLSGMKAEHYATGADQCFKEADRHIQSRLHSEANSDIIFHGYDQASVTHMDVKHYNVEYKHLLLPAWTSAFAFGGKTYTYMINGETGKVSGQRPYSVPKIIAAVAVVILIIAAVFLIKNNPSKTNDADYQTGLLEYQNYRGAVVMDVQEDEVLSQQYGNGLPTWIQTA